MAVERNNIAKALKKIKEAAGLPKGLPSSAWPAPRVRLYARLIGPGGHVHPPEAPDAQIPANDTAVCTPAGRDVETGLKPRW